MNITCIGSAYNKLYKIDLINFSYVQEHNVCSKLVVNSYNAQEEYLKRSKKNSSNIFSKDFFLFYLSLSNGLIFNFPKKKKEKKKK